MLGFLFWIGVANAAPTAPTVPVIQESRARYPGTFAISPDGKWIISSGAPQLWNARGELLHNLEQPAFEAQTPVWASGNSRFFLTGKAGTAIYEMPSGCKVSEIAGTELSKDGRFLIRRENKMLRVFDAQSGRELASVEAHAAGNWNETLDFSPDGTRVVAGQINADKSDGKMRIWNLESGQLERTLTDPRGGFGEQSGVIGPALWSKDGQTLVTGGEDPNWEFPTDNGPGAGTLGFYFHAYAVKVWDANTGQLRHVWPGFGNNENGAPLREFVAPNEVRLSDSANDYDNIILNIETGKTRYLEDRSLSQTRHIVYLNNRTNYFELRAPDGKTLQEFPVSGFAGFQHLAYSPDSALLAAVGGGADSIKIFDAHSGALKKILIMRSATGLEAARSMRWLPNGNLAASSLQGAWIWTRDGKLITHFAPPKSANNDDYSTTDDYNDGVSVAPNGQIFLSNADVWGGEKREIAHVWNGDGSPLRDIPDFGANDSSVGASYDGRVVWIDDARVALPTKGGFEVWNLQSGQRETTVSYAPDFQLINPVVVSPDGKLLLCREEKRAGNVFSRRTVLLEVQNWTRLRVYRDSLALAWGEDGSTFAARGSNSETGTLIFSTQSEEPLQKTPLDSDNLNREIAFSPDLKFAAITNSGHTDISRVATGQVAVSLYLFANPTHEVNTDLPPDAPLYWLALTPDGFYDGSPNIEKWLRWRRGDVLLPVGALEKERRKPTQVRAALQ